MHPVELSHYRYKEVRISIEQIADPIFRLSDVQSNHVNILVGAMHALVFDYHNAAIAPMRCAGYNPTGSSM